MNEDMDRKGQISRYDYYTNQMNIAVFVDVRKVLRQQSAEDAVWVFDNSGVSTGNGTASLVSVCKPGTVVNWLVYALDSERSPDGTWPAFPNIHNIVFINKTDGSVCQETPFEELKIYGGPDKVRSRYTPSYSYWAGNARMDLPAGNYPYRLVIGIDDKEHGGMFLFDGDGLSLEVVNV